MDNIQTNDISDHDLREIFKGMTEQQDNKTIFYAPFKPWEANYINEKSSHDSFEDAFRWLFKKMKENPPTSYIMLETMIWIVDENKPAQTFMDFYQLRDHAYKLKIMKDGKLVE